MTEYLTILMPCLNEAETIGMCIERAYTGLRLSGLDGEVLVADNGSTDESVTIARGAGARVIDVSERGYGNALVAGIQAAQGQWILMGDADQSYDFQEAPKFVERLREGFDLVQGCRLPAGGGRIESGAMPPLHRLWGNPMFSLLARGWFSAAVHDVYCGLRAFRKSAIQSLELRCTGMEFAIEMIIKASVNNYKVTEVPIVLHRDGRTVHAPHLKTFRDGWRTLRFMLLFSPRWLFLYPGVSLIALGTLFGGLLVRGPVIIGRAGFDANTLLVCAMAIIVGVQLCLFAVFTRMFAITERLLPPSPRYEALFKWFNLERGAIGGSGLVVGGLCLLVRATLMWRGQGFGALSASESARIVIPGVTLVTVGIQGVFSSFFLSVLNLKRR